MDIKSAFNDCIRDVRRRSGSSSGKPRDILKSKRKISEFEQECVRIRTSISQLHVFLIENKEKYVNPSRGLISKESALSESEKDQIDLNAQEILKTCLQTLTATKMRFNVVEHTLPTDKQITIHHNCVMQLLQLYLKDVGALYSKMKSLRLKQAIEKKEIQGVLGSSSKGERRVRNEGGGAMEGQRHKGAFDDHEIDKGTGERDDFEPELSPEEILMMEEENQKLFNEMNCMIDEVKDAQKKMEEIGSLQQTFVENVMVQAEAIERIHDTAVGTAYNVEAGNEQLNKAMKNNVDFRVWVLFFLVMCSFSLLFLDWYS